MDGSTNAFADDAFVPNKTGRLMILKLVVRNRVFKTTLKSLSNAHSCK